MIIKIPNTKEEAKQQAIEYQQWRSEQNLSYLQCFIWSEHFRAVAAKFNLYDEFVENGII